MSEKERTKNRKINCFDVKNGEIPENFKIVFRFYELIFVSYLLLNNYRKHFFWNLILDFVYKMFPIIHLRKIRIVLFRHCDYPTSHRWHSIIIPVMKTALLSKSRLLVWVSEWSVEMFTIPAYKERHEGGRSHRPVIMESTLLSVYHRLSDPNTCILSSHVYLVPGP